MRRVSLAGAAIIGALLLAIPAAFAKTDLKAADPGITATSVTIGGTFPLTGPASARRGRSPPMDAVERIGPMLSDD